MNPLESCGKPLFFKVANPTEIGVSAPPNRKGVAIRTSVRSLSVMQKEALVSSSQTGVTWRLSSDEGPYLMGSDTSPCPLSFMTTGMVSSHMNEILALAKLRDIKFRNLRLVQDNYYTMEGSALRGTMTAGALPVELTLEADSDAPRDALARLAADAAAASPVNGLLRGDHKSLFTLSHNGREIKPGKALPIGRPAEPDPGDHFDKAQPAEGDWSRLVVRDGISPKTAEVTSGTGSSYDEHQSRRLHLRGICTLRPDGIKAIEQMMFNPHGSIFHFLCEEGPELGGKGRAPDALSYLSAGIAFCFMTQFGRYAKIVKKDLKSYRVIQDTHFSLGGASGGTGKAGEADPVETHVYLETGEDDAFARTILDMSEQTCFLHAFCKADLKVKVRVASYDAAAV